MDAVKTVKIVDGMSFSFLSLIIVSVALNVVFQWNSWGISARGFIWTWLLVFLLGSTIVLKNSLREHPGEEKKYIQEWGVALIITLTLGILFLSFVR